VSEQAYITACDWLGWFIDWCTLFSRTHAGPPKEHGHRQSRFRPPFCVGEPSRRRVARDGRALARLQRCGVGNSGWDQANPHRVWLHLGALAFTSEHQKILGFSGSVTDVRMDR